MSYSYIPGSLLAEITETQELKARIAVLERDVMEKDAIIRHLTDENAALKAKLDNRKKLSTRDVELIKRFGATTGLTHRELADSFGVNRATVSRILNGTYHKGN